MEIVTIVILIVIAAAMVIYSVLPNTKDSVGAVKRRLEGKRSLDEVAQLKEKAKQAATENLVKKAAPMLSRLIMPTSEADRTALREKLIQAGYRQPQAQTMFLASKTGVGAFFAIAGAGIAVGMGYTLAGTLAAIMFGGGIGFVAPGFWLGTMIKRRQERIRGGLPDVLDLMVVAVESGLALDAALKRCGEEMALVHPDVSDELRIATRESQMGIPRAEALENLATRVGIEELRALVSVVTQAERFGTSVAKALRNQGESMRSKRRLAAEERAQKTAVKLMIPLVLFIFPAMGIVLAGPAGIQLMEAFSK
jgi:tight adherence protein C